MPKRTSHEPTTKKEGGGDAKNQADEDDDASLSARPELPFGEEVVGRKVMILFEMEGKRKREPFLGRVVSYVVTLVEEEPPEPRKLPARKGKKAEAAAASPTSNRKAHKPSFTDEIERKFRVIFEDGDDQWLDLHDLKAQGLLWWQDAEGPSPSLSSPARKKSKVKAQDATAASAPRDDKESAKSSSLESVDSGKKSSKASKKNKKKSSKDSSKHDNDDDDNANNNNLAAFMQQFASQGGGGAFPMMTMPPDMMSMMMMMPQQQQLSEQPQTGGMFMTPWGPWFPPSANSSPWKGGGEPQK